MEIADLCLRIDALIQRLDTYKTERDKYRDALLQVICQGDTVARRIARSALDADPKAHTRHAAGTGSPPGKGAG